MPASETISQILNAAGKIFAEKGFERTTVREICAAAGVNLAAVNYHFGDKERLYIEAVKSARGVIEANAPMPADFELAAQGEDALRVFIRTLAHRMLSRDVESWRKELLTQEFMNPSKACEEMMQESIRPTVDRLNSIIRSMVPTGVPDHTIRQLGFSVISQVAYYRLQERVVEMLTPEEQQDQFTADVLADHITRFTIAAIRGYESVADESQESVSAKSRETK